MIQLRSMVELPNPSAVRLLRALAPKAFLCVLLAGLGLAGAARAQSTAPQSVHVQSVKVSSIAQLRGLRVRQASVYSITGKVVVVIRDDLGFPVAGALVTGTFSSDNFRKDEIVSGVTGPDGSVTITSKQSFLIEDANFFAITFCVDDVAASLPYAPDDNVMTCHTGW